MPIPYMHMGQGINLDTLGSITGIVMLQSLLPKDRLAVAVGIPPEICDFRGLIFGRHEDDSPRPPSSKG